MKAMLKEAFSASVHTLALLRREYDLVIAQNERVYASYSKVGGSWMRALFTKVQVRKGDVLAQYEGLQLTKGQAKASQSEYLMTARDTSNLSKRVILDGDPDAGYNLAGYANYVAMRQANGMFEDRAREVHHSTTHRTYVVLLAAEDVEAGKEIRVDYDMGSAKRPFRDQMVAAGLTELDSSDYKEVQWEYPAADAAAGGGEREEKRRKVRGAEESGGAASQSSSGAEGRGH